MNVIKLLESQHREVEKMFAQIEKAKTGAKKKLFERLADSLAIHTAIEEHQFYSAVKAKRTDDIPLESLEEHVGIKRVLAELLGVDADDETFDAKLKVLKEQVEQHVKEEETDLFPKARKALGAEALEALGQNLLSEQVELEKKSKARVAIPGAPAAAAPLT